MKRTMSLLFFLTVASCLLNTSRSYAQYICPEASYDAADILTVRSAVVDGTNVLIRMLLLAHQSASTDISCTKRIAANFEYVALISAFDTVWNNPGNGPASRSTRKYLRSLLNSLNLNFSNSTILTSYPYMTPKECIYYSQFTAATALSVVGGAMSNLAYCSVSIPRSQ